MESEPRNTSENIIGMKDQSIAQAGTTQNTKPEKTDPHLEIEEGRWPEFRANMRKRFPEIKDTDLPYERRITDEYFGRIEKKFGRSREELRDAARSFYTWSV